MTKSLEADIEERVTMRLELSQLRDAVHCLARDLKAHMDEEEEERKQLENKLTVLIGLMILSLSGVDLMTMIQIVKGF